MKTFKLKALSAVVATGMMMAVGAASAQSVNGAGATLPQPLYEDIFSTGGANGVIGTWTYAGGGSSSGKSRFLTTTNTVNFAGSDSALTTPEYGAYNGSNRASWGPLIQVPAVATAVLIPYKRSGLANLNITDNRLCELYSDPAYTWNELTAPEGTIGTPGGGLVNVVYRLEGSGTTELLSNYLVAACPGKGFVKNTNFATVVAGALPGGTIPSHWVGRTGSGGVSNAFNEGTASEGRVGYLSPDVDYTGNDNSVVAKINGHLPNAASIQAALPAPPVGAARSNPVNWVPAYSLPTAAYPIFGTTNLLVGQCYAGGFIAGSKGAAIKDFVTKLNNGAYDAKITSHNFVKLPPAWNEAIEEEFLVGTSRNLQFGNANNCNGVQGRPS